MRKFISVGVTIALVALSLLLLPGAAVAQSASATQGGGDEGCTWNWSRTIPGTEGETEYHFRKFTRTQTREWVKGQDHVDHWWNWSPNNTQGPQDYTPNFPNDDRGTWQGPHVNGGPMQDTYGTFQTGGGNSPFFHREHVQDYVAAGWGPWSEFGPWTPWESASHQSWEDSTEPIGVPQHHGGGGPSDDYNREWQARHDGQTRIKEGTATDPIVQGPVRSENEPARGDYPNVAWVKDGESKECPPEEVPFPEPTVNDPCGANNATWNVPEDTNEVHWTLTDDGRLIGETQPGFVWPNGKTVNSWGLAEEKNTEPCPIPIEVPEQPASLDPCGTDNVSWESVPADTETLDWTLNEDGTLSATPTEGNVFGSDSQVVTFTLPEETNTEPCPTLPVPDEPKPDTEPKPEPKPDTTKPVAAPAVAQAGPAPMAVNATVTPSSTKTLPNTGGPHALALLLAASLLGLGTVLVRRRA